MKKRMTLLALVALLLATAVPVYAGTTTTTTTTTNTEVVLGPLYYAIKYTDLPTEHWAEPAVRMMSYEGILAGYPDGSFQPNGTVTYGEFIRMATTMTHAVGSDTTADPGRHWAQKYYECGLNCNYYTPYDITEAQLSQPIPRGDMALILAASMRSDIKTENYGSYDTLMGKINDVNSGTKNDTAIIKSYATGALSGYPDGSFRPEGYLTRAEAASAIYRTETLADRSSYAKLPEIIKEEPTSPKEENTSTVDVDSTLGYENTICKLTIRENYDSSKPLSATQQTDFLIALQQKFSDSDSKAILAAAVTFSGRKLPAGKSEIRKQYVGDYPVLMSHSSAAFSVHVRKTTYHDEYWDTTKGEINDFYF